jgi:ribosomal protein S18 acetylase RimI-like enzyme
MEITRLTDSTEAKICAKMMADSEPWITLKRDYESSLDIILDPFREVYIAKEENDILGFIIIEMKGAFIGYIKSIYTTPKCRGIGVGSKLMKFIEDRIFRETPNVFICVSNFNIDAQRFYLRLGYETIGELTNYIVSGSSEILMRKTIAPLAEF